MLYIFDADGTLRITKSGKPCPNTWKDQASLPNVRDKLVNLKSEGHSIAIASNQGGVSWGYMSEYEAWQIMDYTNFLLARVVADIRLCFYHNKGDRKNRYLDKTKPKPDMLLELIEDFKTTKQDTVFVGNEFVDMETAKNAGIKFEWAHEFFNWQDCYNIEIVQSQNGYFPKFKEVSNGSTVKV